MEKERKILFIAYYFPPLGMGGTQRIAKWSKYLARKGWDVYVVTVKPISYYAYDESLLGDIKNITVIRTPSLDPSRLAYLFRTNKNKISDISPKRGKLYRLLHWFLIPDLRILWVPFAIWYAWRAIKIENIPYLITSGPPHSSHIIGLCLSKFLQLNWLTDFRDGWGQGDFLSTPTSLHKSIHGWLEKYIASRAHAILSVSQGLTKHLQRVAKRSADTVHYLPNGYDPEDFCKEDKIVERKRFEITFVGAITSITNPRTLLEGFQEFISIAQLTNDDIRLNFVGADLTGQLQNLISEYQLREFVRQTGYVRHRKAIHYLMATNISLFIVSPEANSSHISGKIFEYLASGKPVLIIGDKIEGVKLMMAYLPYRYCTYRSIDDISCALLAFFKEFQDGVLQIGSIKPVKFSREYQVEKLIKTLYCLEN